MPAAWHEYGVWSTEYDVLHRQAKSSITAMPELVHRRLRAPQRDDEALVDPPRHRFTSLIADNRVLGTSRNYDCQGFTLNELAMRARDELPYVLGEVLIGHRARSDRGPRCLRS